MKRILMTLAHICDKLGWWFAERAGEVHAETKEDGTVIRSWTYK